ncbi:hypothetical protein ACLB2K_000975 [Fragaria x ananassa]
MTNLFFVLLSHLSLSLSTTLITTAASWLGSNLESTTDWEEKKAGKRRNKKKGSVVSGQTHADAVIPSSPVHFVFVNQYHGSGYEALANSSVQSLFHLKEKTVESVVGIHECRNNDLFLRMKVAGKGVVKLMLNGINYAIGDVYCVPELKNNLLSPKGYEMKGSEQMVYNLQKALYGLKQAPRAWFSRIESYFLKEGFKSSPSEQTLFIKKVGGKIFIVSIYVDDLMFTSNDDTVLSDFKCYMKEFEMTDLGELKFFLGIESNSEQPIVTLSTTEAEFVAVVSCACQAMWMRKILREVNHAQIGGTVLMCDNISAIKSFKNSVFHGRTKHIRVRYHFLRDLTKEVIVQLVFCGSRDQLAELMTKPLKLEAFQKLHEELRVCAAPVLN